MKLQLVALGLVVALVSAEPAVAQQGPPPGGPPMAAPDLPPPPITPAMNDTQLASALDPWIAGLVAKDAFSGVILVAHNGREMFAHAYGFADRARKTAPGVDTPFNIASVGKMITQTAIMQLVDAGKLSLDDTVGKWLPDYPQAATRGATITQLLNHKGGLADFFGPKFDQIPKSQFTDNSAYYRFVSSQPPLFAPGEREEYCNGCYAVLGEIIAKVSGKSYERYVQDNIFAGARMSRTVFGRPASAAHAYGKPRPDAELQVVDNFHGVGSAAGGSFSTVRDLNAFNEALRTNKLTSAKATALILHSKADEQGRSTARIGIAGGAPGANALLTSNGEWTVVVLANLDPPAASAGQAIFRTLAGPPPQ
jgi:CubicO group peptidase (beta-lactamase class C family)